MTTPTATIFLPYHALDDVILRGTRAAQPAASAVVAGTLYGVTDEGNVVERSTGAVWQAYSPTGAGALTPHHATHEPGGSDALANLSATTLTSGTLPDARLSANVPLLHVTNTFTQNQALATGAPDLFLIDTSQPANQRAFDLLVYNRRWWVRVLADDLATPSAWALSADRSGNAFVWLDVYEKQRVTPMGHWIDVPFSVGNFSAVGGTWTIAATDYNKYMLVGKTIWWTVRVGSSTVTGGTTQLQINTPAGIVARHLYDGVAGVPNLGDGAGAVVGAFCFLGSTSQLAILKASGSFTAGAVSFNLTTVFEFI